MNFSNVMLAGGILTGVFFNSGCANHLRNIDVVSQENDKKILSQKYELKMTPETIRDASYHVEIQLMESAEVKKYEVRSSRAIATPYQWWREIYEVPTGILLFPVSLTSHLLFLCTFGILPYDVPQSVNELAFAGMNPFLNWESDARSEEQLVSLKRKMLSHSIENSKVPFAKRRILVRSGNRSRVFKTDDFGGFDLNFLGLREQDTFFPLARKVSFTLETDGAQELKRVILTRDYLSKLLWARTKINAYRMNPAGKNLFDTVIYLEKNGFENLAYALEENELNRNANDKKFQTDFKSAAAQQ